MKTLKRLLSLLLVVCVAFGVTACKPKGIQIDKTKTQLYVSNFNGGYGKKWLDEIVKDFTEDYKNVSFEEGKRGVQIIVKNHKKTAPNMITEFRDDDSYVFFNENLPYAEYVAKNNLLDITDVVMGTFSIRDPKYATINALDEEGNVLSKNAIPEPSMEDKNIFGKFNQTQKDGLSVGGKYYAIPHYEGFYGLTYDADLWNLKGWYLSEDGAFELKAEDSDEFSNGPDGIKGTYDDGLPATYDEFFSLLTKMGSSYIPVIWSGENQFYMTNTINQLVADYHGVANETLSFSFNGNSTAFITGWDGDTPIIADSYAIANENGYDVFGQAGYYYGLKWIERLVRGNYVHSDAFTDSTSHTDAQNKFLMSCRGTVGKRIAMLAEGVWWQNEATGQFNAMETQFGLGAHNRNLLWMPLPKADEAHIGKTTLLESNRCFGMIRENMPEERIPLAKLFLQYCNTLERLQEFSFITNTSKALTYDMPEGWENDERLTPFGKSILQMKTAKNPANGEPMTEIVYQLSTNSLYANNASEFQRMDVFAYGDHKSPARAFKDYPSLTAKAYFGSAGTGDGGSGFTKAWRQKWSEYLAKA